MLPHKTPKTGASNLQPAACLQLGMAMNATPQKIVNLLKTLRFFCDYVSQCIYCVAQDNSSSSVAQRCQSLDTPA